MVTLNFLTNGGDEYFIQELSNASRLSLYEEKGYGEKINYPNVDIAGDPRHNLNFSYTGGEQDAFAEYVVAFHPTAAKAYNLVEKSMNKNNRAISIVGDSQQVLIE
jgi:hypothetical protein